MALNDLRQARLEKLEKLQKAGIDAYPARSSRTHKIAEALADFDNLAAKEMEIILAGRVMAKREHGGLAFFDLQDGSISLTTSVPVQIQLFFKKDVLGGKEYEFFIKTVDIGDFIEVGGTLFKTKQDERTLLTTHYSLLTKSLLPLPEKWHGLQDVEERYRKRYLDLIFNQEVKTKFEARSNIIEHLRQYLISNDFLEVETPILQTLYGGANAKPFKTHLNTLDLPLYLRIAPELYLKRLLVGGFEKVFEIGRNFRNEGMDREHNPEFTMLEFYAAYWDYEKAMEFVESMLKHIVEKKFGTAKIEHQGKEIHFVGPYPRVTFNDLFKKYSGLDYDKSDENDLKEKAKELDIKIEKSMNKGNLGDEIYKKVARPNIIQPTFVINHPLEISPLAKKLDDDPNHVARFQLVVGGMEVVNAFSELNDPTDQRQRFEAQEKVAKKGNEEAQRLDEDYIEALEYGMPPAAGVGIGIDRLVVLLTDSHSVREVILFPLMKPRSD
ncbi:MAG: lysine--tRNA ligase [Candidatus Yanofskybacteria bacterium]|nr:lysine--tRNA ligase [Candidatus Yanofskybacteria bacterium]